MRWLTTIVVLAFVIAGCGGDSTDNVGQDDSQGPTSSDDLPDPCSLVDQSILDSYFTEAVEPSPSGSGAFLSCTWSDSNANALIVSVARSDSVNRPDTCPGCIDLTYGDDGYATSVPLQSMAEFVRGDRWYSVSTTGLGDDVDSIAALGQLVFDADS